MAKTTAPLLSFGASGAIAKTQVYARWKGRAYARRYVTPANPQTTEQSLTRDVFRWLQQVFKLAPPLFVAPWTAYAKGKVLTDRNAFSKFNVPVLRVGTDLVGMSASPGALGGLSPASVTPVGGVGQITVTIVEPASLPTGWTIQAAVAACILEQDPHVDTDYLVTAGEDLATPYSIVLSGLAAGTYRVFGWLREVRADALVAYSPSTDAGTVVVT